MPRQRGRATKRRRSRLVHPAPESGFEWGSEDSSDIDQMLTSGMWRDIWEICFQTIEHYVGMQGAKQAGAVEIANAT